MGIRSARKILLKYRILILINVGLLAFLLTLIWIKPIDELRKYCIYNHSGEMEEDLLPIYDDIKLVQYFTGEASSDSFEIFVLPVNAEYHGSFSVRLCKADGNVLEEWQTDKLDVADGWIQYRLRKGVLESGDEYRLEITAPQLDEFKAIGAAVFNASDKVSGVGDLEYSKSGETQNAASGERTLSFGIYRHQTNFFAICAFICLFGAVNLCWFLREKGTDVLSIPILIASGLIMLFILAPGCGPDDSYHYYSSMVLSNKIMLRDNTDEIERKYESDLPIHRNTNKALVETYEGLRYRVHGEDGTYIYEGRKDKLKWPISHISQAIGITIGRFLKMGFIRVYTLGRLFNLAAYIALAVLAVRLVPINKELMLMLAILPMPMQQASQLSYDMAVNGLALVYTAYTFRIIYEKKSFTWKETIISTLLLVAISPLKVIYILLGLLMLLIPGKSFRSLFDRIIKLCVQLCCAVVSLALTRGSDVSSNVTRDVTNILSDTTMQKLQNYSIRFVLTEPIRFVRLILSNAEDQLSNMFKGMIGGSLAGFTVGIPEQFVMLLAFCLLLCALSEEQCVMNGKLSTAVLIAIPILGYFAVLTVFAFTGTSYGFRYIGGTQGRYLTPFLCPFAYCLCGRKLRINIDRLKLFVPIAFVWAGYIVVVMSNIDF